MTMWETVFWIIVSIIGFAAMTKVFYDYWIEMRAEHRRVREEINQ